MGSPVHSPGEGWASGSRGDSPLLLCWPQVALNTADVSGGRDLGPGLGLRKDRVRVTSKGEQAW